MNWSSSYEQGFGRRMPSFPPTINWSHPMARELRLQYLFAERGGTQGNVVRDTSRGTTGTIAGLNTLTWSPNEKFGGVCPDWGTTTTNPAKRFNIANNAIYKPTAAITVMAWIYAWSMPTFGDMIASIDYHNDGTWNAPYIAWALADGYSSTPTPAWYVTTAGALTTITGPAISLNRWYHLAGTYDGSTMRLLIDGQVSASAAKSGAIDYGNNGPLCLGEVSTGGPSTPSQQFHGRLWDFRVYGRALSQGEILWAMREPLAHLLQPGSRHPSLLGFSFPRFLRIGMDGGIPSFTGGNN